MFVDLTGCIDSSYADNLFLGSMIFDVSNEKEGASLEVIDGQQRLTTLVIALMAARDYARDVLGDEALALSIARLCFKLKCPFRGRTSSAGTFWYDWRRFSLMCDYGWDRSFPATVKKNGKAVSVRRQVSRLKPIYSFCTAQIAAFCGGDVKKFRKLANQIVEHTFVIRIDIEDRAEAFEIFERRTLAGRA